MPQPVRHSNGIFYLRRKVPEPLRAALGHEYKVSLKTRDPIEAKVRFAGELLKCEALFRAARAQAQGSFALSAKDVETLASRWFAAALQQMDSTEGYWDWLVHSDDDDRRPESLREAWVGTEVSEVDIPVDDEIRATLRDASIPWPTDKAIEARLRSSFIARLLDLSDVALMRIRGDWNAKGRPLVEEPVVGKADRVPSTDRKLSDLFKLYQESLIADRGDSRSVQKTIRSCATVVRHFIELEGDLAVFDITRETVMAHRIDLAKLPASGEGVRKHSARQLIAMAGSGDLPKVKAATLRNKLRYLSAVLTHGVHLGWLKENPVLASGVARRVQGAVRREAAEAHGAKDFSLSDLARIFGSRLFQEPVFMPSHHFLGAAWKWLPLLMYYTGARREEVGQLMRAEVKQREGIWFIDISAGNGGDDRTLKNEASRREVPLHRDLIARGFLEYVESVPSGGPLFPGLAKDGRGFYTTTFGKAWGAYLRKHVGVAAGPSPSHGFRHTFKTLARGAGMSEDVIDAIVGHTNGRTVARGYGTMPLTRKAEELAKYPSL